VALHPHQGCLSCRGLFNCQRDSSLGSSSEAFIVWKIKHCLIAHLCSSLFGGKIMMGKRAVVTVELVDESVVTSNGAIAEELLKWFRDEVVPVPWVKKVKTVVVQVFRR
jgi:hypothetical protein